MTEPLVLNRCHAPPGPTPLLAACSCRVQLLEISQYLENYLWPHFEAGMAGEASYEHLMSMVVMVNQKFREQVPGWACFHQHNPVSRRAQAGIEGRAAVTCWQFVWMDGGRLPASRNVAALHANSRAACYGAAVPTEEHPTGSFPD